MIDCVAGVHVQFRMSGISSPRSQMGRVGSKSVDPDPKAGADAQ